MKKETRGPELSWLADPEVFAVNRQRAHSESSLFCADRRRGGGGAALFLKRHVEIFLCGLPQGASGKFLRSRI